MKKKKKTKSNPNLASVSQKPIVIDVSRKKSVDIFLPDTYELTLEQIDGLIKELEKSRRDIESLYFSSNAAIERIEGRSLGDLVKVKIRQLKQRKELNA